MGVESGGVFEEMLTGILILQLLFSAGFTKI
jgi:hypothetical protein